MKKSMTDLLENALSTLPEEKWMQKAFGNPKTKGTLRKAAASAGAITDKGTIDRNWLRKKEHSGGKTGSRAKAALNANP